MILYVLYGIFVASYKVHGLAQGINKQWNTTYTDRFQEISTRDHQGPFRCPEEIDCGEPLFLTPMLQTGSIQQAQQASKVTFPATPEFQHVHDIQSFSGFFTVNETTKSNIFFWFFPAESDSQNAPVLLWLEGGPGMATSTDIFMPNGPFRVDDNLLLFPGPDRWTDSINVLYIDNPVGAGFSFTRSNSGYAKNQEDYTRDLYAAVSQFFQLFPDYRTNEFFIAGVSYGGKYVPALAYEIHIENPTASAKINLKGIAIGNGLINPLIQVGYSDYLYGISVIDPETKDKFGEIEAEIKGLITHGEFVEASNRFDDYIGNDGSTFSNVTSLNFFDYLWLSKTDVPEQFKLTNKLIKSLIHPGLLKSIHVGHEDLWITNSSCYTHLNGDILQSVAPKLQSLMDDYQVLLYNGQLDILCNYRLMIETVRELDWKGAEDYRKAIRHQWWVDGELAGYSKAAGNFVEVLVRNAGHEAHWYQSKWTHDLIRRFTQSLAVGSLFDMN